MVAAVQTAVEAVVANEQPAPTWQPSAGDMTAALSNSLHHMHGPGDSQVSTPGASSSSAPPQHARAITCERAPWQRATTADPRRPQTAAKGPQTAVKSEPEPSSPN
jgi:hypothetical protein